MKKLYNIIIPVLVIALLTGCKKNYADLYKNNNQPTDVPAALLFNGVLNSMADLPSVNGTSANGGSYEGWDQYYIFNYDYYGNNKYEFSFGDNYYNALENVVKMEEEAKKTGGAAVNPYNTLGKFFRAYFFTKMSMELGDIPMTQALLGISNLAPVYDPQKKVFQQALLWLDTANTNLTQLINHPDLLNNADGQKLNGDIYFNNDLKSWQKLVNTFRLRLL